MIGTTVSHYKIMEKLGEGGMGVVYKAHDLQLDRIVAIKFVTASDGLPVLNEQLLAEARAASKISHPNVCIVYAVEQDQNKPFIVLEWIHGQTLLQKVRETGPLPLDDALNYTIQTTDALTEAHRHDIIHRDIKSDNIMVNTRDEVKVTDFGLAGLKNLNESGESKVTAGTMAYMSPEQITGKQVDARSDIFSLGVVLYEILTGKLPFRGDYDASIMYSVLNEPPERIKDLRPEISDELAMVVHRALEKEPDNRFPDVEQLKIALMAARNQGSRGPDFPSSPKPGAVRVSGKMLLALCILLLGLTATYYGARFFFLNSVNSIAVLPFVNSTNDAELDYVSDGLTENLINSLTYISTLRVVPRSSVFYYRNSNLDPIDIGRKLDVKSILTGRITKRGDRLTIQAELVNLNKESQVWGEKYTRPVSDLLDLETNISKEIVSKLELRLNGNEARRVTKSATNNQLAYQYYLKGQYHWGRRTTGDLTRAIEYFTRAVSEDSAYAEAYSGLARTYAILQEYSGFSSYEYPLKAEEYALKALAIDPSLGECHAVLGFIKQNYFWDYAGAEKSFKEALEINPNDPTTHQWYAILLSSQGRFDEALEHIQRAQSLDPLSVVIGANHGLFLYFRRHYGEAISELRKTIDLDPSATFLYLTLAGCYLELGDSAKAIGLLENLPENFRNSYGGYLYAQLGRNREAQNSLALLKKALESGYSVQFDLALVNVALGNRDLAIHWLEKAADVRHFGLRSLRIWKIWDPIRDDPRFQKLLNRIGLKP